MTNKIKHIEYIEDSKGLYGLIIRSNNSYTKDRIISVRPDQISYGDGYETEVLYHCIPRKWKKSCLELSLLNIIASSRLAEAGLSGYSKTMKGGIPKEKRKLYYAVDSGAGKAFNGMWKRLIKETAHKEALKTTYKFPFKYRKGIYNASATSERALQLTNTFPFLASVIYNNIKITDHYDEAQMETYDQETLIEMVESGKRLKDISKIANVQFVLRLIKPLATSHINYSIVKIAREFPDIFYNYLPKNPVKQLRWLFAVRQASYGNGRLLHWVAKNADVNIKRDNLITTLTSISDWARVEHNYNINCNFETAVERANLWHRDAEFRRYAELNKPFPEPWIPQETYSGFEFIPLLSGNELFEEGKAMHHCVGTYASFVTSGSSYIYSIRKAGKRLATLELRKMLHNANNFNLFEIGQIRAECNKDPEKNVMSAALKWVNRYNNQQEQQEQIVAAE